MSAKLKPVYVKCAWGGSSKQFFQRRTYAEDTGEIDLTIGPHISCLQSYFEKEAAKLQKIFLLRENVKICPEKRNMACNTSFLYEVVLRGGFYTAKSL